MFFECKKMAVYWINTRRSRYIRDACHGNILKRFTITSQSKKIGMLLISGAPNVYGATRPY